MSSKNYMFMDSVQTCGRLILPFSLASSMLLVKKKKKKKIPIECKFIILVFSMSNHFLINLILFLTSFEIFVCF